MMIVYPMPIYAWIRSLRARGLRDETIKLRKYHVERACDVLGADPTTWTRDAVEDYLTSHDWAASTLKAAHNSLKSFCQWHPSIKGAGVFEDMKAPSVPRGVPRPVDDATILEALRTAPPRVQLMIELMAYGGLRRGEVARVRGEDVSGQWLTITGKGGHVRHVPLPPHLLKAIESHRGYVFPGDDDGHLSPKYVGKLVARALPDGMTGHQLRHRFATVVYRQSHDIVAVQNLLGHAKLDTTMIYTRVDSETQRDAASMAWRLGA